MLKRTDCREFEACQKMFKDGGTDFTCEGCPGPGRTRRIDPKDLKPWELKELERKAKVEKKKEELAKPETNPIKSETITPKSETIQPKGNVPTRENCSQVRTRETRKDQIAALRERLKDNPRALAELDMWEYQENTEWYLNKSTKEAGKVARLKKHFLRG